jgi:hypothetical protein
MPFFLIITIPSIMSYIDIKVTVWNRLYFDEATNLSGLIPIIEHSGIGEVIDHNLGYLFEEALIDSEQRLDPIDNSGFSTIKVYSEEKLIWENGKTNQ